MRINHCLVKVALLLPLSMGLASAQAEVSGKSTTTTTTTIITTAVPAPRETVVEPEGYVSCEIMPAGWQDKTWHPEYKVCRYDTKTTTVKGEEWIAGHWQCSEYTMDSAQSECTGWDWSEGHWAKTFSES